MHTNRTLSTLLFRTSCRGSELEVLNDLTTSFVIRALSKFIILSAWFSIENYIIRGPARRPLVASWTRTFSLPFGFKGLSNIHCHSTGKYLNCFKRLLLCDDLHGGSLKFISTSVLCNFVEELALLGSSRCETLWSIAYGPYPMVYELLSTIRKLQPVKFTA